MVDETKALKDYIDRAAIERLARQLRGAHREFPRQRFVTASCRGLAPLEFTARTAHVAKALRRSLPQDVPAALEIIVNALPPPLSESEGMFSENF